MFYDVMVSGSITYEKIQRKHQLIVQTRTQQNKANAGNPLKGFSNGFLIPQPLHSHRPQAFLPQQKKNFTDSKKKIVREMFIEVLDDLSPGNFFQAFPLVQAKVAG